MNEDTLKTYLQEVADFILTKAPRPIKKYGDPSVNEIIKEIKKKCTAYEIVYDPEQEREFAKHMLSKKRTGIAAQYGFKT